MTWLGANQKGGIRQALADGCQSALDGLNRRSGHSIQTYVKWRGSSNFPTLTDSGQGRVAVNPQRNAGRVA
jgi:hypothetical protein